MEGRSGPIYLAIADAIERDIAQGVLTQGTRLPPQRDLAYRLGVTLGTITRGYAEAERRKLVQGETGRGTYVNSPGVQHSPLLPRNEFPETFDLARNFALPHLNPDLRIALTSLAKEPDLSSLMNYIPSQGLLRHREAGAVLFRHYGVDTSPDEVLITCGGQHAILVLLKAMFNPGDAIAVDEFTYPSLLSVAAGLGLKIVPICSARNQDGTPAGMCSDTLEEACRHQNLRGLFIIPNVQNPTTHTLTLTERKAIARVAGKYNLGIIEDDPYTLYLADTPVSFVTLLPDQTTSIASISKVIAPGLRTAFVRVPASMFHQVLSQIGETTWMAPPLTTEIGARWIMDGTLKRTLAAKSAIISNRFDVAQEACAPYQLQGSREKMFVWLSLPERVNPSTLEADMAAQNIEILAANHFQLKGKPVVSALRVALGTIASDSIFAESLWRLRSSIDLHASGKTTRLQFG